MAAKIGLQKQLQICYPGRKYFTSQDKSLLAHLSVGYEWGCDRSFSRCVFCIFCILKARSLMLFCWRGEWFLFLKSLYSLVKGHMVGWISRIVLNNGLNTSQCSVKGLICFALTLQLVIYGGAAEGLICLVLDQSSYTLKIKWEIQIAYSYLGKSIVKGMEQKGKNFLRMPQDF